MCWRRTNPEQLRIIVKGAGQGSQFVLNKYIGVLNTIIMAISLIEVFGNYADVAGDAAVLANGISIIIYDICFGILVTTLALIMRRSLSGRMISRCTQLGALYAVWN